MKIITKQIGTGVHIVEAVVVLCGKDINICCGGGDTFHIGASALAVPRPSLADATKNSASASVLCVTSHKEDEIAREAALRFATIFKTRVNITCGLHIDNATADDINLLHRNYLQILDEIQLELAGVLHGN